NFDDNSLITNEMKTRIRNHLIPPKHRQKSVLDQLFIGSRPTLTTETLVSAGFNILHSQRYSHIQVVSHPQLVGWLLKLYTDNEKKLKWKLPGWEWLVNRCLGAQNVRNLIKRKHFKSFTVPDKYLYPLPELPCVPEEHIQQPIVLLVEDMNICSPQE